MPKNDCMNWEINAKMCPCQATDCDHWGVCCECISNHRGSEAWPLTTCMRETKRPEATVGLQGRTDMACVNLAANKAACACTAVDCERHGLCCDCVRNHWTGDGAGRVTCMR